jgi:hypothetical protein
VGAGTGGGWSGEQQGWRRGGWSAKKMGENKNKMKGRRSLGRGRGTLLSVVEIWRVKVLQRGELFKRERERERASCDPMDV